MKRLVVCTTYVSRQAGQSHAVRYHSTRPSEAVLYVALDGLPHNIIVAIKTTPPPCIRL